MIQYTIRKSLSDTGDYPEFQTAADMLNAQQVVDDVKGDEE